ncbi:hypothetical protein [Kitasatospora sp. NPDC090091]|uniref:hypothetical protein n=1 Tax=Kitasatospora sp. NPDC090091 TaxID=3364081 RepID=UPI00382E9691
MAAQFLSERPPAHQEFKDGSLLCVNVPDEVDCLRVFGGATDPIDPQVETAEQVRDRVLQAARHIPADRLGTCDDAGFSPFADAPEPTGLVGRSSG